MNKRLLQDSVLVKAVSLASICIRVSSNYVEAGGKVWARIDGIFLDSFVLGTALEEPEQNRFSISLNAKNAGKGTIMKNLAFSPAEATITVDEARLWLTRTCR
ncbi:unnamed protein product, partial [Mesorhabditis spiculigera]